MEEEIARVADPQRIRALAHPLRIELIEVLGAEGEATATRCAEITGESVASCSFHLRMLAKYGFVEPGAPRGREKPWRLAARTRRFGTDADDPASVQAIQEWAAVVVEREADRLREWIARVAAEPQEWVEACRLNTSTFWATPEEAAQVSQALSELTDRFARRRDDPASRPPGARPVRLFGAVSVDPHWSRAEEEPS
ncbi:winged helix-turn-helix domain-containing protein [Nonomuraea sp. NPDC049152]|uniref:winged helix-turn-helix domain-containing protein n=1 Tax=Nonomuraea sp. NPDC049152 TaxID=3154350 RepID=UPI0033C05D9C